MKRIVLTAVLSVLLIFVCMPSIASADWGFRFGDNGWSNDSTPVHYNFNKIIFNIPNVAENTGITWLGNGVSDFNLTGWTAAHQTNSNYVVATGPTAEILFWNVLFTGTAPPANFTLGYVLYNADNNLPAFGINMFISNGVPNFTQGIGWTPMDTTQLQTYGSQSSVPVPPAILLLGTGLVGIAALRKRIHR